MRPDLKQLKILQDRKSRISDQIYKIEGDLESEREEEMKLLVGCCVKSNYSEYRFRKILDFVINKKFGLYFIFEEVGISEQGEAYIKITSDSPYTNNAWRKEKIPVSGWVTEISTVEYQKCKLTVLNEMENKTRLKKFLTRPNL